MSNSCSCFCRRLPKMELHAHLNGSLSADTLRRLSGLKRTTAPIDGFRIDESTSLDECFKRFPIAQALTDTAEAVKVAVADTLQEFSDDGVVYVELRSTPRQTANMSKREYVQAMVDGVKRHAAESTRPILTTLLVSIDRRQSLQEAEENVRLATAMHREYPDIVRGIDLSGNPHAKRFADFVVVLDEARREGLKVTVHAGESPTAATEILEILLWKPDRLGHMVYFSDDSPLWDAIIDSKIPIEMCVTSNVKTESVASYGDHPFKLFFKAEHPLSISTDDKGVFDTSSSKEHFLCMKHFNLSYEQLWSLSFNAIDHMFANEAMKTCVRDILTEFKSNMENFK